MLVAIALGGAAVLIAVGVVARLLVRRSRPSTIGTEAVGVSRERDWCGRRRNAAGRMDHPGATRGGRGDPSDSSPRSST